MNTSWRRLEDVLTRTASQFDTAWKCLEDVLKTSLQDSLKPSWIFFEETSWRIKDVLKECSRRYQKVFKTCWRCLEDVFARHPENAFKTSSKHMAKTNISTLIKTSWSCLEDIWLRQIYSCWSRRLENILKTSSKYEDKRRHKRGLHKDRCLLRYMNWGKRSSIWTEKQWEWYSHWGQWYVLSLKILLKNSMKFRCLFYYWVFV